MNPLRDNPLNPRLAEGVRRVGFRKWYERELLSGHAHMVLAFLSVIALIGSLEAFRDASAGEKLMDVAFALACGVIGLWALRRYLFLLLRAEEVANQASCAECGEYGRFDVVTEDRTHNETQVCCRKCTHQWKINVGS
jgi:ABC-type nickel/cobalt efflux system permease component RcnA